jgi:hypothetical protein
MGDPLGHYRLMGHAITVAITRLGAEAPLILLVAGDDLPSLGVGIDLRVTNVDHGIGLLSDKRDCCTICLHR